MIKAFGSDISGIKAYGSDVTKVMAYGEEVWSKQTSIPDYLCFTALESGTFTLTVPAAVTSANLSYVEYSLDGRNWTRLTIEATDQSITAGTQQNPIPAGGKVYWRGSGNAYAPNSTYSSGSFPDASYFRGSADYDVSGNIMSLLYADDFADKYTLPAHYSFVALFMDDTHVIHSHDLVLQATTLTYCCYEAMFRGCTHLVSAPVLPATTMSRYCYTYMFQNTAITAAPALPATSLDVSCYSTMFYGCTGLTAAPELPATTLANTCYNWMFRGCTNLETAPELKATTLVNGCYTQMFNGCSKINYIKCLATDISATNCLSNWLNGVSTTGVFVCDASTAWTRDSSGIPATWVKVDKRTMPSGYKQVEYVNNTAQSGRVNTGIIVDYNSMTVELAIQQDTVTRSMPLCNASASASGDFYWYSYLDATHDYFSIAEHDGSGWKSQIVLQPLDTKPHTFKVVGGATKTYYCDGVSKGTKTYTSQSSTIDTAIFGQSGNANSYGYVGKVYFLKIVNDTTNTTLADYVPCVRESDSVVGFWDFASSTFKESRTANTFVAGQEI